MRRRQVMLFALGLAVITGGWLLVDRLLLPTALEFRADKVAWSSIEIRSENLQRPVLFPAGSKVILTNISHGPYLFKVTLDDGRVMWMEYLHIDAGARRRVTVDVRPGTGGRFRVEQHARLWPFGITTLFQGSVVPDSTSEQKPAQLGWI